MSRKITGNRWASNTKNAYKVAGYKGYGISRMERQKLFGISIGFSFSFKYKARSAENKDISKTHTTQLLPRNWVILCLNEKRPRLSASSVSRAITTRTVRFVATQKLSFAYFLYTVNFLDNDPSSSSFPPFFLPFLLSSFNRLEVRASTVYIYIYMSRPRVEKTRQRDKKETNDAHVVEGI